MAQAIRKYPVGIQPFSCIIDEDYVLWQTGSSVFRFRAAHRKHRRCASSSLPKWLSDNQRL